MIGGGRQVGSSYRDVPIPERLPEVHVAVTAALCWWDERPEDLEACVRNVADVADRIVALDGAYARFPGGTPASDPLQAATIRRTAESAGLECLVITPDRLWAGQLEKRTYLYRLAALATDWLLIVDADHIIHADREAVRAELADLPASVEVISAPYVVTDRPGVPTASRWHRQNAGQTFDHNLLFRALPDLRVEGRHWWISAARNGGRVWVVHTDASGLGLPGYRLRSRYEVEHRYLYRDRAQVRRLRSFLRDREQVVRLTDQEDDVAGIFRPVYA